MRIIDNFLINPDAYRRQCLDSEFGSHGEGPQTFHGISIVHSGNLVRAILDDRFQPLSWCQHSFLRKSPSGQIEPSDIHTDAAMGTWTGILYLNPTPHPGDGTVFWMHKKTGAIGSNSETEWNPGGHVREDWTETEHVEAKFNRMLIFPATRFHSRSLVENFGTGEDSRLIQVTFGGGDIPCQ